MNKNFPHSRSGFTLIELLVVITIMVIVLLATYIPYAHHQKKVLIKQWAKELVQSLTEARNLAINGLRSGSGNVNVGLYFTSKATQIDYYISTWSLDIASPPAIYKTKKRDTNPSRCLSKNILKPIKLHIYIGFSPHQKHQKANPHAESSYDVKQVRLSERGLNDGVFLEMNGT